MTFNRARLNVERWFGDPENPMHFRGLFDGDLATWKYFYAEIPFFYDTLLTVGKTPDDYEADYYFGGTTSLPNTGGYAGLASQLTDRDIIKFQLEKQFGMGKVLGYVAHPDVPTDDGTYDLSKTYIDRDGKDIVIKNSGTATAWELFLMGKFQFNEQFGFDLGFQAFKGDNAEMPADYRKTDGNSKKFNDMWTVFAGLRFNFNENVAFKGIFYHQKWDVDYWLNDSTGANPAWREWDAALTKVEKEDDANHWSVMVDVKQEALKFTSLWLEYGQYDKGFRTPHGKGAMANNTWLIGKVAPWDFKYYRIGLGQEWNEKWATYAFYYGYKPEPDGVDNMSEWGLGVRYKYNPNVTFGLNFSQADNGVDGVDKDNRVRFRTQVTF
jgi:hypothetical protein